MSGRLIAIEGIDGSGKGTQTERLARSLSERGLRIERLEFPCYETNRFGRLLRRLLDGDLGPLEHVPPELAAIAFAGDRRESRADLVAKLAASDVVLTDRYTASNIAHQAGRLAGRRQQELIEFLAWCEFEFFDLIRPDLTVYLAVSADVASANLQRRAAETGQPVDLAESDSAHLRQSAAVYGRLAEADGWVRVDCESDGQMRSLEAIAIDVESSVCEALDLC